MEINSQEKSFDTIIVPAREIGFQNVFLSQSCWHAVRIHISKIKDLRYIAVYRVAPLCQITHIAEIAEIYPYLNTRKYEIKFIGKPQAIGPIVRNVATLSMQTSRYAFREKILNAKHLGDIWSH